MRVVRSDTMVAVAPKCPQLKYGLPTHRFNHTRSLLQINGLENGTQYYVRVAAYNGPGGENSSTNSTEGFATYGLPADASHFPIMTIEQARVPLSHNACN